MLTVTPSPGVTHSAKIRRQKAVILNDANAAKQIANRLQKIIEIPFTPIGSRRLHGQCVGTYYLARALRLRSPAGFRQPSSIVL